MNTTLVKLTRSFALLGPLAAVLAHCTPQPPVSAPGEAPQAAGAIPSAAVGVPAPLPSATAPPAVPASSAAAPLAPPSASPAAGVTVPAAGSCDNDRVDKVLDCSVMPGLLGTCGAMAHYSCPQQEKRRPGTSFRAGTAARIGHCYLAAGPGGQSCGKWEACVRSGIAASCAKEDDLVWCKKNLPVCDADKQELCAKILSSMEPALHDEAIRNIRDLNGPKLKKSCRLTWDFNGFPFCPFCSFGQ